MLIGTVLVASLLVQVKSTTGHFARPDTTQEQFMKDRWECIQQQQPQQVTSGSISSGSNGAVWGSEKSHLAISASIFVNCMAQKGYVLDKRGPLFPPRELEVPVN